MLSDIAPGFDQRLIGLGIALGIGFIIGLEREWAEDKPVGVRSFALIGILGGLCGLLVDPVGGSVAAAGLLILGAILAIDFYRSEGGGITTIVAAIVVFMLGLAAVQGFWLHSIVIGGAIMVLLHWKKPLHQWVDRIGDRDFETIVRFTLITLVILPVLPDRTFGPYQVFNPFRAWLLVVLIVAINLTGYLAFRFFGRGAGAWLAGALGGLVSSTATTLAYSGLTRRKPDYSALTVVVILVASTVVYGRVLVELAIVSPTLVRELVFPSAAISIVLIALAAFVFLRSRQPALTDAPTGENPARIREALTFAAIYVVILFILAAVRDRLGEEAVYAVAVVSGLTDVDALTLSVGQLHADGNTSADTAWRAVFLATLANLVFKAGAASIIGAPELRRPILATAAIATLTGLAILFFWP
ncbi:MAG: MgtC/SapB family protein [Woeseiaceae bacterium]|jgi:uncharacterized membrane protein (DUF4010 family)|nr:MgtC/SapB family protein [Woeseiaceae bacterium]